MPHLPRPTEPAPGRIRVRSKLMGLLLLTAIGVMVGTGRGWAETRVALVVGNGKYASVPVLRNAVADARAMRDRLAATGFEVVYREDADRRTMNRAVEEFVGKLSTDSVALFYYAGHGVQLGSTNYLIPTDIKAESAGEVADDAVDLNRVLERVTGTQARFALAIVDACRDNPFRVAGRSVGGSRGLAPSTTADGVMVVYSAGANQTALDTLSDRDADPNGLFTREWLRAMTVPGRNVQAMALEVRQSVAALARSVGHVQTPAVYDQSLGTFEFVPASALAASGTAATGAEASLALATPAVQAGAGPAVQAVMPASAVPSLKAEPAPSVAAVAPQARTWVDGRPAVETAPSPKLEASAPAPVMPMSSQVSAQVPSGSRLPTPATAASGPPAQDCDRLAQAPARQLAPLPTYGEGVATEDLDSREGAAACARAASAWPDEPRFLANAARIAGKVGNESEEARLYRVAADRGNAFAQFQLGSLLAVGRPGLDRDEREAARLLRMAADQGLAAAQEKLAAMYVYGEGGLPQDDREAVRLWRLAAAAGNDAAQRNLRALEGHRSARR